MRIRFERARTTCADLMREFVRYLESIILYSPALQRCEANVAQQWLQGLRLATSGGAPIIPLAPNACVPTVFL